MGKGYSKHPLFKKLPPCTPAEALVILRDVVAYKRPANDLATALISVASLSVTFFSAVFRITDRTLMDEWVSSLCLKLTKLANNRKIIEKIAAHPNPSIRNTVGLNVRSTLYTCFSEQTKNRRYVPLNTEKVSWTNQSIAKIELDDYVQYLIEHDPNGEILKARLDGELVRALQRRLGLTPEEFAARVNELKLCFTNLEEI